MDLIVSLESKLLKPGQSYMVGRKAQPLLINHKGVSAKHVLLAVGSYSEDDSANPDHIPRLEVTFKCPKPKKIKRRDGEEVVLIPDAIDELRDGDTVMVTNEIHITVRWEKVCCYSALPRNQYEPPIKSCANLGISLVMTPHPDVTHHLVASYTLKPAIAASLVSLAHFVKSEWLDALLTLGEPKDNGPSSLEHSYALPRISDHKPDCSPSIPSTLKLTSTWEPNESRVNMFRGHRVIFVGEKGREATSDDKDLVKRGGGDYECFAVSAGRKAFHNILAKGSSKANSLILIADEHFMGTAIGQDSWMEFVQEAAEYRLKFVRAEKLVSAVMHVDMTYVDCILTGSEKDVHRFASPLPDVVPNTLVDEPTYPPQTAPPEPQPEAESSTTRRRPLLRRAAVPPPAEHAAPAPVSVEPAPEAEKVPDPPPRRKASFQSVLTLSHILMGFRSQLTRRARTPVPEPILGIDDPSVLLDGGAAITADALAAAHTQASRPVPPTPGRARLKRRHDTITQPTSSVNAEPEEPAPEPSHKKFKDLFDQSDPDKVAQSGMEEYKSMFSQNRSFTQSEAVGASGFKPPSRLNAVAEEEEESGTSMPIESESQASRSGTRKQKRKAVDEDVEMDDEENPRHKRRTEGPEEPMAVEKPAEKAAATESVEKPKSKALGKTKVTVGKAEKSQGASGGKVDKDDAFLKAVASTKRGKKKEDEFDREFNNLRISKPDLKRDEAAHEWAVVEQFGDDENIRGNFMVVVEMEVFRKEPRKDQSVYRRGEGRMDWEGKPDFKKFKKKGAVERRPPIELVVEQEPEFNFGANLHITDSQDGRTQKPKARAVEPDSDEEIMQPLLKRRNTKATQASKASESAPASQTTSSGRAGSEKPAQKPKPSQKKGKEQALFLAGSDDETQASGSGRPSHQSQQQEDSDVEIVPKPAPRKAPTRRKPVVDDDSDDGLAFKGFTNRRRR
ncbi:hypothetical protein EIP91_007100 [Steccherinum ochraceum]|uniref:FHA domain-containing protein n=1 Tax=Steccherinum ochraceum TaxID=92696 RepID=A0A4R0R4N8_9APHY|nr:hypothetical protein EIP91_007100 [Steccherinum ochraceum]